LAGLLVLLRRLWELIFGSLVLASWLTYVRRVSQQVVKDKGFMPKASLS
jgi:hypothetical protein